MDNEKNDIKIQLYMITMKSLHERIAIVIPYMKYTP